MSRQFKLSYMDKIITFPGFGGPVSYDTGEHKITYLETQNGSISGDKDWALTDELVTLSDTPSTNYELDEYFVNGISISGNSFLMPDEDVDVSATFKESLYHITYTNDGHGTCTGPATCTPGSSVTISNSYNNYYRFKSYTVTNGTINGNVLTPTGPNCTVKANFKLNSFTASGNFEKGSNVTATGSSTTKTVAKYCVRTYSTSNVPSSWYSTSSRWKPPANTISGYSITLNGRIGIYRKYPANKGGQVTACLFAGSTNYQSQTWGNGKGLALYSKSQTLSTVNVNYGVSAKFVGLTDNGAIASYNYDTVYSAACTSGTWKATGVIK